MNIVSMLCDKYSERNGKNIDTVTIHHMAGAMTASECAAYFQKTKRKCSSNYCIGYDGSIALAVEECKRAWSTGNKDNDERSINIEVSNIKKHSEMWEVSVDAITSLENLLVDIADRHDITNFTLFKNVTLHSQFKNTLCPGPFLTNELPKILNRVNERILKTDDTGKWIQIASFTDKNNANGLKNFFKRYSLPVKIQVVEVNSINRYRVLIPDTTITTEILAGIILNDF